MNFTSLKISTLIKNQSPVFIVGAPRSGTTLLYRILQRHSSFKPHKYHNEPQIKCPNKYGLSESKVFLYPYETYFVYNHSAYAYMLCDDYFYSRFLESTKCIQKYQELFGIKFIIKKVNSPINWVRLLTWKVTLNHLLVRAFFYHAKSARGMKRILEKSPHVTKIPEIKATFPQAKLLFIYRHPLDVFGSYRRRLKVSLELGINQLSLVWLRLSPKEFCDIYSDHIKLALREQVSNPGGFMSLRYEDITSNPRVEIHRICGFLGESYEERCLSEEMGKRTDWKIDPDLFSDIKKVTKNWKDFVSKAEAQFIEERLHEIMNLLDYPRYT